MGANSSRSVQTCITNIVFPQSDKLEGLIELINKNRIYNTEFKTDLDVLLNFEELKKSIKNFDCHYWTAPKWLKKGDILFFYYASTSLQNSRSMLKRVKEHEIEDPDIIKTLEHSIQLGKQYSGKIFGYAVVKDAPKYLRDKQDRDRKTHFKTTIYAPFNDVHLFEEPLKKKDFSRFVRISNHGALTPIFNKNEFEGIKSLLTEKNLLPPYLRDAKLKGISFKEVTKDNWFEISCSDDANFIYEEQFRVYSVDHLLTALKDNRTALLKECLCYKGDNTPGRVDYFMKIDSTGFLLKPN